MTSEQTPKDLKAILAKIACAETDDIAKLEAEIFPEMVDLSEAEVDKVFQQLKVMTKISMAALRKDWTAYLSANGLGAKTRETSAATALIDFVLEDGGELWRDPGQNAWLTFRAGDHREHHPLKSRAAKRYFAGLYFRKVDRAPPGQALQDAIQTLEAKAIFEGAQHTPFVRIAADADSTYLDLAA